MSDMTIQYPPHCKQIISTQKADIFTLTHTVRYGTQSIGL